MAAMIDSGWTYKEVGSSFGVSDAAVWHHVRAYRVHQRLGAGVSRSAPIYPLLPRNRKLF